MTGNPAGGGLLLLCADGCLGDSEGNVTRCVGSGEGDTELLHVAVLQARAGVFGTGQSLWNISHYEETQMFFPGWQRPGSVGFLGLCPVFSAGDLL